VTHNEQSPRSPEGPATNDLAKDVRVSLAEANAEEWVREEAQAIRCARAAKLARLEALGIQRPGMTAAEITRVVAFSNMIDAHFRGLPREAA
jgi:hypothetical protein